MNAPVTRRWDRETRLLATLAICVSMVAFFTYYQRGCILLYGDAVAHINIARRVFDSRTPGPLQLGTVWLPLPHLLMIPFIVSTDAWQSGAGGSIPSLIFYVLGVVGIFRLVRDALSFGSAPSTAARLAGWLAAIIYGANPNLLYLQSTAMTESLYLGLFAWAVVFFNEYLQALRSSDAVSNSSRALIKCGICLAGAELTRYDGWFTAGVFGAVALLHSFRVRANSRPVPGVGMFILLIAAAPICWLSYNTAIYRNPMEFANGPYSARAIEQKTARPGYPPHPGTRDLVAATQYFVKSAEFNLAEGNTHRLWLLVAIAGTLLGCFVKTRLIPLLVLWVPLPFYILSIAYGGIPVFVPTWWPFSYYNVRYGIQLLPAVAVFVAFAAYFLGTRILSLRAKVGVAVAALFLVAAGYASVWRAQSVCLREAWINSRTRLALENELGRSLKMLPRDSILLMYLGDHVGALQQAGIPLRRTINEGNHRTWKQPSDPEGLWERALADPAKLADFAVGIGDDPVSVSARQHHLQAIAIIGTTGQPRAAIYFTGAPPGVTRRSSVPQFFSQHSGFAESE